jgi:hypothetical protein
MGTLARFFRREAADKRVSQVSAFAFVPEKTDPIH